MGTASPPAQRAASVRFGHVGGVVSVCMCVYFCCRRGLGPHVNSWLAEYRAPGREPIPPGTRVPGRLSAGRAAAHDTSLANRRVLHACRTQSVDGLVQTLHQSACARRSCVRCRYVLFCTCCLELAGSSGIRTVHMRSCTCAVRCKPGVAVPHGGGWSAPPHGFPFHLYVYSSGTVRNHFNMHTVTHSNHVAICHLHLAGPFPPRREVLESDGWCTEDDNIQFMHQCRSSARVQASLCVACGVQPWACGCHRGFQYP